jgi:hypothetical protein
VKVASGQQPFRDSLSQDGSGGIYATWLSSGSLQLAYSSSRGASWTGPVALASDASLPASAVNSSGQGWAVYAAGGTEFARSFSSLLPPPPVVGKSVDLAPVSGVVLVKQPGHKGFIRLHAGGQIPVGSTVNATRGVVSLVAARDRHGHTATGQARGGVFRLTQKRAGGTELTVLRLVGKPTGCSASADSGARHHSRHRPLVVRDPGFFVTVGIYASARDKATRHTKWWTEDTCAGTRITAVRGAVLVHDFPHHRTFLLRAGHHFLAHRGKGG